MCDVRADLIAHIAQEKSVAVLTVRRPEECIVQRVVVDREVLHDMLECSDGRIVGGER